MITGGNMRQTCSVATVVFLCIHAALAGHSAQAAPVESHEHWEHIVKRSALSSYHDSNYEDDTAHIVDVQEYYREVLRDGWDEYVDNEEDLFNRVDGSDGTPGQGQIMNSEEVTSNALRVHQKPIKGRYIVMFHPDTSDYALDRTIEILQKANEESNQRLRATDIAPFRNVHRGFTATLNSKTVELMHKHPLLAAIEEDVALRRSDFAPHRETAAESHSHHLIWNLDRIDQHENHPDGHFYPEGNGANVDVYIIDTGIHYSHHEFGGRARFGGFDAIDNLTNSNLQGADCHGHGTHCAATAAGAYYGVAKRANIYSLRALDCTGSGAVSGIIDAMNYVIQSRSVASTGRPAVFSMSLGLERSVTLNMAIRAAVSAGIAVVSAAGNQGGSSCDYSPASARVGISVGATDERDRVVLFSNTGECTDVFAPGARIVSATHTCDTCVRTLSGTSMACPHVTGYAAILLGLHPQLSPQQLKERVIQQSTKNVVSLVAIPSRRASGTPNRLLYVPQPTAKDSDIRRLTARVAG